MVCDTRLRQGQTAAERKVEVRATISLVDRLLAGGIVKAIVDKRTGAIAFAGLKVEDRNGMADACVYRYIMSVGSATAKMRIQAAEASAGRTVNRQAVVHGHAGADGHMHWHPNHSH